MAKTTTALETPLRQQLDRLAAIEPSPLPFLSVYLNLQPDQHGRENYDAFLRKTFAERGRAFPAASPERQSYDGDVRKMNEYLAHRPDRSSNALAMFACGGVNLFEAIELSAPIDAHWLFIGSVPHLYPLARLNDQYPRYAALMVDTNSARLFVFALAQVEARRDVRNLKTRRGAMGGWSQARYQRHIENFHEQHMKEVVDLLNEVVRDEHIARIVVSCDEVARPLLLGALPKHLEEKIVDVVHMDINAPEHEVLQETLEALRGHDATSDAERVEELLDQWRAGGLATAGSVETLEALERAQVEELLITASPSALTTLPSGDVGASGASRRKTEMDTSAAARPWSPEQMEIADMLVTKAQQTASRIRFIEDADLLARVGGCGALLRFRI